MTYKQWCDEFDLLDCGITRKWWDAAVAAENEACEKIISGASIEHGESKVRSCTCDQYLKDSLACLAQVIRARRDKP
jgi:hypothetical protein